MKAVEILRLLEEINKSFYTISDLEKVVGLPRNALYVTLKRWVDMKILERIGKGIYISFGKEINLEVIAPQLYIPNYLSFEYALAKYGLLNLQPYTLTYATTRKTRRYTIAGRDIEFRMIKRELFWGYRRVKEGYIAEKEKAFLDQLYFVKRGMATLDLDEVNLKVLSKKKINRFAKKYPSYVSSFLEEIGV
ncbi:hypothetical protein ES703_12620 [subsurface metagenome]